MYVLIEVYIRGGPWPTTIIGLLAGTVKMTPIETMSSKELGRDYTPT